MSYIATSTSSPPGLRNASQCASEAVHTTPLDAGSAVVAAGLLKTALRLWEDDRSSARSAVDVAASLLRSYTRDQPDEELLVASVMGSRRLAPWQARKAAAFINASLGEKICLRDCADTVHLSVGYFSQAFKSTFGTTVGHYIRRRRIEHAQQMMLMPGQSLVQVALACGFADQAHYCRVFRQEIGISPNKWRRLHMTAPAESAGQARRNLI